MPQSLSQVYSHIIFSTKNREPLIDNSIQPHLFDYIGGVCKSLDCNPVQVGGHINHVHILCLLSKKISQVKLLELVKNGHQSGLKYKVRSIPIFTGKMVMEFFLFLLYE